MLFYEILTYVIVKHMKTIVQKRVNLNGIILEGSYIEIQKILH